MALKGPITYTGYDSENKEVATCTAVDATTLLYPEQVKTVIEAVVEAFNTALSNSANDLRALTKDTDEALVVKGTKLTETVEDTATTIDSIPAQVEASFKELYQASITAHDQLQTEINKQAKATLEGHSGVSYVKPDEV